MFSNEKLQISNRENLGREKVLKRNPKFISPSKSITVNMGGVIKLPCEVDKLGTSNPRSDDAWIKKVTYCQLG